MDDTNILSDNYTISYNYRLITIPLERDTFK